MNECWSSWNSPTGVSYLGKEGWTFVLHIGQSLEWYVRLWVISREGLRWVPSVSHQLSQQPWSEHLSPEGGSRQHHSRHCNRQQICPLPPGCSVQLSYIQFPLTCIHSFTRHITGTYCMAGTVLTSGVIKTYKADPAPAPKEQHSSGGTDTGTDTTRSPLCLHLLSLSLRFLHSHPTCLLAVPQIHQAPSCLRTFAHTESLNSTVY